MTLGPATLIALAVALLATLGQRLAARLGAPERVRWFVFGLLLALVVLAGPLVRLP